MAEGMSHKRAVVTAAADFVWYLAIATYTTGQIHVLEGG